MLACRHVKTPRSNSNAPQKDIFPFGNGLKAAVMPAEARAMTPTMAKYCQ